MGEIIPKLAALGITGARFVIAMSVASGMGLTGAAVITTALSSAFLINVKPIENLVNNYFM